MRPGIPLKIDTSVPHEREGHDRYSDQTNRYPKEQEEAARHQLNVRPPRPHV
eukprot:CAMPEP_0182531756 /NCGR_PEP_ID=MMETSP1323-20130603/9942_1 /TAXON_ID=236787 /ORGANISM="Florenciella parvula, Strain RCC1693" /LENGTH=51 /DNA_ID=CAMNT_0024741383 /DNA_START=479 /DNA_END=634 /DNA_ORIENTATION=+